MAPSQNHLAFGVSAVFCVLSLQPAAGLPAAAGQDSPAPATLLVGTKEAPPFAVKNEDGTWRGLTIELWDRIAGEMDLAYALRETALQGLLAGLESRDLDAAVGALTVTAERLHRIDFSHPFHTSGLGIAVPAEKGGGRWLSLLARFFSFDFARGVGALALVLAAVGLVVWLLERRRNPEQFGGRLGHGVGSGFWWSAVTMTTVGYGDKAPRTAGGRLVAIVWMFASIILISSFTAAIASSLTVQQLSHRIEGPDDLPGNTVATIANSTSHDYLRRNGIAFRIYDTPLDGLRAVAAGEVQAIVYDAPILRYLATHRLDATVHVLPVTFERQDYAIGLPAGSALRKPLNEIMLRILHEPAWEETLNEYLGR
jgi:ABC-type amino acid transport substrate-binding protein